MATLKVRVSAEVIDEDRQSWKETLEIMRLWLVHDIISLPLQD